MSSMFLLIPIKLLNHQLFFANQDVPHECPCQATRDWRGDGDPPCFERNQPGLSVGIVEENRKITHQ